MEPVNGKIATGTPKPPTADDIDVDLLEATVGKWDSTLFEAQVVGVDMAVDPEMANLVNAGREYAALRRAAEQAMVDLQAEETGGCPICHTPGCTSSHK